MCELPSVLAYPLFYKLITPGETTVSHDAVRAWLAQRQITQARMFNACPNPKPYPNPVDPPDRYSNMTCLAECLVAICTGRCSPADTVVRTTQAGIRGLCCAVCRPHMC